MRGSLDLLLLVAVVFAAWTRTPAGAVATSLHAAWEGAAGPDLFASYRTSLPEALTESLARVVTVEAPPPPPEASVLAPAVRTAIATHLGADVLAQVEALPGTDPEARLETWAVGPERRARAIERARAAGYADPAPYATHRAFLADVDRRAGDHAVADVLALSTALDLSWPADPSARVTSAFGPRRHPVLGVEKLHEGVDIALPTGSPVTAAASGRVSRAREDGVSGRYVVLDHGHGVTSAYCHASELHVTERDTVERGALILASGSTGRSTGPHLHFGLRIRGRAVDPVPFRPAPSTPAG